MLDLIRRGSIAGLLAGASVALVVFVYDLVHLEPLATPRLLASNLIGVPLGEIEGAGMLAWTADFVGSARDLLLYTVAHFGVYALVGVLGAWLFGAGGVPGNLGTGALFGIGVGSAVLYLGARLLAPEFVDIPGWQLLFAANAVAGIVIVAQLTDAPEPEAA